MSSQLDQEHAKAARSERQGDAVAASLSPRRPSGRAGTSHDTVVKSATRALEIIELFGICAEPLSVSDIAGTLNIPQSSSSILLKAMNKAGFIDRDRQTRKYSPSIRAACLGNRVHDAFFHQTGLLRSLDQLSLETGCSVRLGVRNGIYVQDAHIASPETGRDRMRVRPGAFVPICHDALGAMLLVGEKDEAIRAIVRHANAVAQDDGPRVRPDDFLALLDRCRRAGFSETAPPETPGHRVLSVRLLTPFDVPAAIGMCVSPAQLDRERAALLHRMQAVAQPAWSRAEAGQTLVS